VKIKYDGGDLKAERIRLCAASENIAKTIGRYPSTGTDWKIPARAGGRVMLDGSSPSRFHMMARKRGNA